MADLAKSFASFDGNEPNAPWVGGRITDHYQGGFYTVGGSNPAEGKVPFDTTPGPSENPEPGRFWNLGIGEAIPDAHS